MIYDIQVILTLVIIQKRARVHQIHRIQRTKYTGIDNDTAEGQNTSIYKVYNIQDTQRH